MAASPRDVQSRFGGKGGIAFDTDKRASDMGFLGRKADDNIQTRIDCLIGPDASLEGNMAFRGGLRIDGRLTGNLRLAGEESGTLMVGEQGCVDGHVNVTHAILSGRVTGTVLTQGLLELHPTAVVNGDVCYGAIKMHAGAVIEGQLMPNDSANAANAVSAAPAALAATGKVKGASAASAAR
jgi:cytoskeletal protein CcmA (bactofilin family)